MADDVATTGAWTRDAARLTDIDDARTGARACDEAVWTADEVATARASALQVARTAAVDEAITGARADAARARTFDVTFDRVIAAARGEKERTNE
jgi:hypothetical protein